MLSASLPLKCYCYHAMWLPAAVNRKHDEKKKSVETIFLLVELPIITIWWRFFSFFFPPAWTWNHFCFCSVNCVWRVSNAALYNGNDKWFLVFTIDFYVIEICSPFIAAASIVDNLSITPVSQYAMRMNRTEVLLLRLRRERIAVTG